MEKFRIIFRIKLYKELDLKFEIFEMKPIYISSCHSIWQSQMLIKQNEQPKKI